jgi:hypothetical protein
VQKTGSALQRKLGDFANYAGRKEKKAIPRSPLPQGMGSTKKTGHKIKKRSEEMCSVLSFY